MKHIKKCVIIGCGNIGFSMVKRIIEEVDVIYVFDKVKPAYLTELESAYQKIRFYSLDVTDNNTVHDVFQETICKNNMNEIDFVLCSVGVGVSPLFNQDYKLFAKVMDLNLYGTLIPIKWLVELNVLVQGCRIVVVGSTSGHFAGKAMTPYAPSKWALCNACRALKYELEQKQIRLDVINPRTIKNIYSKVFTHNSGIDVENVVDCIIKSNDNSKKGRSLFVPSHYKILHKLERIMPWTIDLKYGLKPLFLRKNRYKKKIQTVLITGGTSGLGKSLAYVYAKHVCTLYLIGRNEFALNEIKKDIESSNNCKVVCICADLSKENGVHQIVSSINEKIDLVINNAGQSISGSIIDVDIQTARSIFMVNCLSPIHLTAELLNKGNVPDVIVNVLSTTAIAGRKGLGVYSSSKAGLWCFTKTIRRNYGNKINIIEVIPATFKSGLSSSNKTTDTKVQNGNDFNKNNWLKSKSIGMTSEYVADKVYKGISRHKDCVYIPGLRARLFLVMESLFPRLFDKVFE